MKKQKTKLRRLISHACPFCKKEIVVVEFHEENVEKLRSLLIATRDDYSKECALANAALEKQLKELEGQIQELEKRKVRWFGF